MLNRCQMVAANNVPAAAAVPAPAPPAEPPAPAAPHAPDADANSEVFEDPEPVWDVPAPPAPADVFEDAPVAPQ
eukprot:13989077-Alexandrium_andersonii.AAC.1